LTALMVPCSRAWSASASSTTRVLGIPVPGHRNFNEVNLRFYVRRRAEDGTWRRAVVFVREFVPRRAVATGGALCYNEPYDAVPMRPRAKLGGAESGTPGRVAYLWQVGNRGIASRS
jgi:hypothetical protein